MNPLLKRNLGSLLRAALVYFAADIEISDAQAETIVEAVAVAGAVVWIVYKNRRQQKVTNTALAMPQGSTLAQAEIAASSPVAPPASLPLDVPPRQIQG